jgi:hypothetical protein
MTYTAPPDLDLEAILNVLHQGLHLVDDLHGKLRILDDLMLSGRPHEIAEAAAVIETTLDAAAPGFSEISATMKLLGTTNLRSAAEYWRRTAQADAAGLADSLRLAIERFAKRSIRANRRAQQLNQGLNTALRTLHALGIHDSGRLIAQA